MQFSSLTMCPSPTASWVRPIRSSPKPLLGQPSGTQRNLETHKGDGEKPWEQVNQHKSVENGGCIQKMVVLWWSYGGLMVV